MDVVGVNPAMGICVCDVEMYTLAMWEISGQNMLLISVRSSHLNSFTRVCGDVIPSHLGIMCASCPDKAVSIELVRACGTTAMRI